MIERGLAILNRKYYLDPKNQRSAVQLLGISENDLQKSLLYTEDKYRFGMVSKWLSLILLLFFTINHGFGFVEGWAWKCASYVSNPSDFGRHKIIVGMMFYAILGLGMALWSLPFNYYFTFVVETRHGFNRQTTKGFFSDFFKGLLLGALFGGLLLTGLLWVMQVSGTHWWVGAWILMSAFSLMAAWIYPTFLAPLFNRFTELPAGELRTLIFDLAKKIHFSADQIFVMDASKRSSHGNAYFTGVFGKKRIVLFDTLLNTMSPREVVAVLAHELGHFKLNHVRWGLIRGILMSGFTFYLLSLCLPLADFYYAFGLRGMSDYGALIVFGMWFGTVEFFLQPVESFISRKNEFAADRFAKANVQNGAVDLSSALLKLRETSHSLPIVHPWYSRWYYSHPPMSERITALKQL